MNLGIGKQLFNDRLTDLVVKRMALALNYNPFDTQRVLNVRGDINTTVLRTTTNCHACIAELFQEFGSEAFELSGRQGEKAGRITRHKLNQPRVCSYGDSQRFACGKIEGPGFDDLLQRRGVELPETFEIGQITCGQEILVPSLL